MQRQFMSGFFKVPYYDGKRLITYGMVRKDKHRLLTVNRTMKDEAIDIAKDRFKTLKSRYTEFTAKLTDMESPPVKVYDPLKKEILEELQLIRETSKSLQLKKDEDIKKAAELAKEAAQAAEKRNAEEKLKTEETEAEKQE